MLLRITKVNIYSGKKELFAKAPSEFSPLWPA
jgi:hypothetical protein